MDKINDSDHTPPTPPVDDEEVIERELWNFDANFAHLRFPEILAKIEGNGICQLLETEEGKDLVKRMVLKAARAFPLTAMELRDHLDMGDDDGDIEGLWAINNAMLAEIVSYLGPKDWRNLTAVCRSWHKLMWTSAEVSRKLHSRKVSVDRGAEMTLANISSSFQEMKSQSITYGLAVQMANIRRCQGGLGLSLKSGGAQKEIFNSIQGLRSLTLVLHLNISMERHLLEVLQRNAPHLESLAMEIIANTTGTRDSNGSGETLQVVSLPALRNLRGKTCGTLLKYLDCSNLSVVEIYDDNLDTASDFLCRHSKCIVSLVLIQGISPQSPIGGRIPVDGSIVEMPALINLELKTVGKSTRRVYMKMKVLKHLSVDSFCVSPSILESCLGTLETLDYVDHPVSDYPGLHFKNLKALRLSFCSTPLVPPPGGPFSFPPLGYRQILSNDEGWVRTNMGTWEDNITGCCYESTRIIGHLAPAFTLPHAVLKPWRFAWLNIRDLDSLESFDRRPNEDSLPRLFRQRHAVFGSTHSSDVKTSRVIRICDDNLPIGWAETACGIIFNTRGTSNDIYVQQWTEHLGYSACNLGSLLSRMQSFVGNSQLRTLYTGRIEATEDEVRILPILCPNLEQLEIDVVGPVSPFQRHSGQAFNVLLECGFVQTEGPGHRRRYVRRLENDFRTDEEQSLDAIVNSCIKMQTTLMNQALCIRLGTFGETCAPPQYSDWERCKDCVVTPSFAEAPTAYPAPLSMRRTAPHQAPLTFPRPAGSRHGQIVTAWDKTKTEAKHWWALTHQYIPRPRVGNRPDHRYQR